MTIRLTVPIGREDETAEVVGWETATPGLIANRAVGRTGWVVTHVASGRTVASDLASKDEAINLANALGRSLDLPRPDWTSPESDLKDTNPWVGLFRDSVVQLFHEGELA